MTGRVADGAQSVIGRRRRSNPVSADLNCFLRVAALTGAMTEIVAMPTIVEEARNKSFGLRIVCCAANLPQVTLAPMRRSDKFFGNPCSFVAVGTLELSLL